MSSPVEQFEVHPAVTAERVNGGTVLVHLETNEIFELNATAGRIFELLRAGLSRGDIAASLAGEFEVDGATVERRLDDLLAELRRRRIVL